MPITYDPDHPEAEVEIEVEEDDDPTENHEKRLEFPGLKVRLLLSTRALPPKDPPDEDWNFTPEEPTPRLS